MKLVRREPPEIGISFLDTITCGVGAIILLMTVTTTRPHDDGPSDSDPRAVAISQLQRELFAAQAELGKASAEAAQKADAAKLSAAELAKIKAQIAALDQRHHLGMHGARDHQLLHPHDVGVV